MTRQHSRELLVDVVLGLVDVVLDGHVSVRLHVSNMCIQPSAWRCVFHAPPCFDATRKSVPRWRLALSQEAARGISLRPVSDLRGSVFSLLGCHTALNGRR